jgi:hypothetical protein
MWPTHVCDCNSVERSRTAQLAAVAAVASRPANLAALKQTRVQAAAGAQCVCARNFSFTTHPTATGGTQQGRRGHTWAAGAPRMSQAVCSLIIGSLLDHYWLCVHDHSVCTITSALFLSSLVPCRRSSIRQVHRDSEGLGPGEEDPLHSPTPPAAMGQAASCLHAPRVQVRSPTPAADDVLLLLCAQ